MSKQTLNMQLPLRRRRENDDQEGWLIAYADLITLLFIFFSLVLSVSVVSRTKFELMTDRFQQQSSTSLSQLQDRIDKEIQSQGLGEQVQTQLTDEGLRIRLSEGVLFATAEADLNAKGQHVLQKLGAMLANIEERYLLAVEGHTDDRPIHTTQYASNWSLSAARGVNVIHFLSSVGLDEKRMVAKAFADTRPVQSEKKSLDEKRASNRRVTLLVH